MTNEIFKGFKGVAVCVVIDFTDHDDRDPPPYLAKTHIAELVKNWLWNSGVNIVASAEEIKSGLKEHEGTSITLHVTVTFARAQASSKMTVTAYSIKVDACMAVIRAIDPKPTDGQKGFDAVVWQNYFMGLTSSNPWESEREIKAVLERGVQKFIMAYYHPGEVPKAS